MQGKILSHAGSKGKGRKEMEGRKEGRKEHCRHVKKVALSGYAKQQGPYLHVPGASARGRNPGGCEPPENPCCNQKGSYADLFVSKN